MGLMMAVDPYEPFYEVRLLLGPHLIARVEINQPRPDVCQQLGGRDSRVHFTNAF